MKSDCLNWLIGDLQKYKKRRKKKFLKKGKNRQFKLLMNRSFISYCVTFRSSGRKIKKIET